MLIEIWNRRGICSKLLYSILVTSEACISEKFSKLLVFFSCHVYVCAVFVFNVWCVWLLQSVDWGWGWLGMAELVMCCEGYFWWVGRKRGEKKWSLSSYGMKRKSGGLGLNDVDWVLELLVIGLLGLWLGVAMGLWEC